MIADLAFYRGDITKMNARNSKAHLELSLLRHTLNEFSSVSFRRGVYTNVPVFRYDLGKILIIMNDKKKRIVKPQY